MEREARTATAAASIARPLGHRRILERLERAAASLEPGGGGPLAHALIFAGPDGVGKYCSAMWWAARLKCRAACEKEPYCPDCRRIRAGSHGDVRTLEPAGKGNEIGIEEVRALIHAMSLKAVTRGPQIGILRDAERLSFDAQGAMLKLLEEPPGLAVLVLVTRNPAALLPTVRSRCQTLRFGLLERESLQRILTERGMDETLASKAAILAHGSAGRALQITRETLDAREALLEAFERFRTGGDSAEMLATLFDANAGVEAALTTLLEAQIGQVEEFIDSGQDHRRPLASALRLHQALDDLARRGNPRLVVRDMLFDLGAS